MKDDGQGVGVARGLRALWDSGSVGGLTDGQLLDRFVERRDEGGELAFAALVIRHGPMVLRVARDVLRDPHSAEDAFQATFLVLARKARSIARPEALGPWLHGVAHRVARKARVEADRRRRHETVAAGRSPLAESGGTGPHFEATEGLRDEVARLPSDCRAAVVLCYFEGLTYDQAAGRLGVTEATVRGRLARARRDLRGRLLARGASASWSLPIVPGRWIGPTARAASRFARGFSSGAGPSRVEGLAEGVLRMMVLSKLKVAALLVALQIAAAVGLLAGQTPSPTTDKPSSTVPAPTIREPLATTPRPDDPPHLSLTLDQAIDRLIREDPDLKGRFSEIPQAKANLLTAGLRANPVFYADSQLVPYGQYIQGRPVGQTQYDVNTSYSIDVTRKRQARADSAAQAIEVGVAPNRAASLPMSGNPILRRQGRTAPAVRPARVIEAHYLDAARLKVDALALAFGEALRSRDLVGIHREAAGRMDRLPRLAEAKGEAEDIVRQTSITLGSAWKRYSVANITPNRAVRALAWLLAISEAEAAGIEVVGKLADDVHAPTLDSLNKQALDNRPDLMAYRIGLDRARQDVRLSQDQISSLLRSLALAPNPADPPKPSDLPPTPSTPTLIYNQNAGPIDRMRLQVDQTTDGVASLESQILSEVKQARREYESSSIGVQEAREEETSARNALDTAWSRYEKGTQDLASLLAASSKAEELACHRLEVEARIYRAKVALNTAVGRRVLP